MENRAHAWRGAAVRILDKADGRTGGQITGVWRQKGQKRQAGISHRGTGTRRHARESSNNHGNVRVTATYETFLNPRYGADEPYGDTRRSIVSLASRRDAVREIRTWPAYAPTPLLSLPGIARAAGVARVWYKDEGPRFGLGSFKALGGAYGVLRALEARGFTVDGSAPTTASSAERRDVTVTTATDGNHGRSVAWGASLFGCRAIIYLPKAVSPGREAAIRTLGADIVRVDGNYDDAVARAQADADHYGYTVVSDTSYAGYTEIPRHVMQGYGVIAHELDEQLRGAEPTHAFLQGGVGAFAASIMGHYWDRLGTRRPRLVVVEPQEADCLFRSAVAGRPTTVTGEHRTIMAGLAAGEVSLLAWQILESGATAFMTVVDELAADAMRLMAEGRYGDQPVTAGESAVAGLAALLAIRDDHAFRTAIGLDADSQVLLIGTEGATDPATYERIVGRRPPSS